MKASWLAPWRSSRICSLERVFGGGDVALSIASRSLLSPRNCRISATTRHQRLGISVLGQVCGFRSLAPSHAQHVSPRRRATGTPPLPKWRALSQEEGAVLSRHRGPLTAQDVWVIFRTSSIDGKQALRLLRVIQGRRINGTLDLPLPKDLGNLAIQDSRLIADALNFLRHEYPVDEDAAILRRIEAEESAQLQLRQSRGQEQLRPQSGQFGEQRGKNNSVFGTSVLEQWRASNREKAKLEDEKSNQIIDELDQNLKREGKPGGLIRLEDQDLSLGRPITTEDIKNNVYLKWKIKHQMEASTPITAVEAARMTLPRRLLPSLLFTTLFCSGCYWLSQTWVEPSRLDRLWPNIPLSAATIMGIILANTCVFALWRLWPPALKYLNRYFISIPGYPYALSMLGNTFSHQRLKHFLINMLGVWFVGLRLHEEVGRGTFLGIYLSSGVVASFATLAVATLRRNFVISSLGASGSLAGIMGSYLTIHWSDPMQIAFLPAVIQDKLHYNGSAMLISLVAVDVLILLFFRRAPIDSVAHLGGWATGIASGWWWKQNRLEEEAAQSPLRRWYEKTFQPGK